MPNYRSTGVKLIENSTPKADSFYIPAEWEPHEFTIMAFPPAQNWVDYGLNRARHEWATVANTINEFEPVLMAIDPDDFEVAKRLLSGSIELVEIPVNDGWSRDSGPIFLVNGNGERRVAGFTFNGWGAKFPPYDDDALLKARLCEYLDVEMYEIDLVLEGGGIVFDGEGTVMTTEQCLLHPNRNPGMTKSDVEAYFSDYLGASKTIWLDRGLEPDPITDGHVDGICAYAAPGVVLLHTTDDRNDPNYEICKDAKRRLQNTTDARGRSLEVIDIPLGERVAHIGFYIVNGGVIVPLAGDREQDDEPLAILRDVFPDREVVGVSGQTLAEGGGSVHCITQQVPKV
ncbi:MAG: agmatine deiminase family protein [Cyanobacteria bacterium SID2]|nr:agmatine deiminase family protein [Cyanobacteria bacterium SID2]MBP0005390.1 agmatine deiminase family protein [Cyanobacteria bacterium SBC]